MTKKPASVRIRRPESLRAVITSPAFRTDDWCNGSHAKRTEMTLEYIRQFDKVNSFVSGNTYTFGSAQA